MIAKDAFEAGSIVADGAPGSSAAMSRPLDLAHLARYTLRDPALEAEVLSLFTQQAPVTIARLRRAESERQWRDAAHTLKGSARAIGAWHVAQQAEECEQEPDWQSASRRSRAIEELERALADVHVFISTTLLQKLA